LAEEFQSKINEVILPIRLGIFALYSNKNVSIFNRSVLKILDHYIKIPDFLHKGEKYRAGNSDTSKIDFAKYVLD